MKTLYFDCGMGAAGDMLTAALLELVPDPDAFMARLNALGIDKLHYTAGNGTDAIISPIVESPSVGSGMSLVGVAYTGPTPM